MTDLMAAVKVLEGTHKEHMAGVTTSFTLMKEAKALAQLKTLLMVQVDIIDGNKPLS